ncbi:Tyrosine recombinase XerD [Gammaproteobacteria bacterium]
MAMFVASEASAGKAVSTIERRLVTINYLHQSSGFESPTKARVVLDTVRGIKRVKGTAQNKKTPLTAARIKESVSHCSNTLAGLRDRALLLLGFAGAFRRSELVRLTVEDLQETKDGYKVIIKKSKTDQTGEGQTIAIMNGGNLRVVTAVKDWLKASGIKTGAIFRSVSRYKRIGKSALTDRSVANIVKKYADAAGLDPTLFSGHSLRSGCITSAAESGASILKMMEVSRHKSVDELIGYVRSAELFKDHAGSQFL